MTAAFFATAKVMLRSQSRVKPRHGARHPDDAGIWNSPCQLQLRVLLQAPPGHTLMTSDIREVAVSTTRMMPRGCPTNTSSPLQVTAATMVAELDRASASDGQT